MFFLVQQTITKTKYNKANKTKKSRNEEQDPSMMIVFKSHTTKVKTSSIKNY